MSILRRTQLYFNCISSSLVLAVSCFQSTRASWMYIYRLSGTTISVIPITNNKVNQWSCQLAFFIVLRWKWLEEQKRIAPCSFAALLRVTIPVILWDGARHFLLPEMTWLNEWVEEWNQQEKLCVGLIFHKVTFCGAEKARK